MREKGYKEGIHTRDTKKGYIQGRDKEIREGIRSSYIQGIQRWQIKNIKLLGEWLSG